MIEKAVIDRFEGIYAVVLVGDDSKKIITPKSSLPKKAREGDWLKIDVENDHILNAVIDLNETSAMKNRIAEKLARLRKGDY